MKFQVFHVNPGEKLMKKDDNNKLIRSFINFPIIDWIKVIRMATNLSTIKPDPFFSVYAQKFI